MALERGMTQYGAIHHFAWVMMIIDCWKQVL
jgi:hypothetical protein